MAADENWNIFYCAGYVVPPCKHLDHETALAQIQGSAVALGERVYSYFHPRFVESLQTCTVSVVFTSTDGEQRNEVRDLVRRLAFGPLEGRNEVSRQLAVRLGLATDKRSHRRSSVGLFIVLAGSLNDEARVVLFKFPADESLQATFAEEGLSINVIEGAFSRGGDFFKAAVFEGNNAESTFWNGKVEDKQANQSASGASEFWVTRFLQAMPRLTDIEGSQILGRSFRNVATKLDDPSEQQMLIAAAITLKSQSDRKITFGEVSNYLSPVARELFLTELRTPLLVDIPFVIDGYTLDQQFAVKAIVLDNRFSVVGPINAFDNGDVYVQNELDNGTTEIVLRGRIVSEQLKTTRSLPKG